MPVDTAETRKGRLLALTGRLARHPVARNAASLYGIQVAGYVLPLLTYPYLARVLHAEKLGLIAFSQAFVMYFVALTEYGFGFSATREIAVRRNDPAAVSRIFTAVMAAKALLMLLSLVVLSVIVFATPKLRAEWPLFYISFLTVLGGVLFPVWLFQGLEKMQFITFREVGSRLVGLLTIFVFVHRESDYLIAAAIQSGSMAFAGLVGLWTVPRVTGVRFIRVSFAEIRATLKDGWHIFLSTAAITLYTSSNTFILGLMAPARELGLYSVAQRITDTAKTLVFPLSTAIYPHVSHMAANSREMAVTFIKKYMLRLTAPFALISAGLLIGAPVAVSLVGGSKFAGAVPYLRILAPIPCIVALGSGYATYYMLGLGYKKEWSRMIMQAGVVNFLVLAPLLILLPAPYAVAITAVCAELFVLVRAYAFYRKKNARVEMP